MSYKIGDRVKAKWYHKNPKYYPGIIAQKPTDWVFVKFDDGDVDFIPIPWIKEGGNTIGSRVYARFFHDEEYHHGTIASPPDNYEFIKFDDGDEAFIPIDHIKI